MVLRNNFVFRGKFLRIVWYNIFDLALEPTHQKGSPSGALLWLAPALLGNIGLGRIFVRGTDALAFFAAASVTKKKSFVTLTLGHDSISFYFFTTSRFEKKMFETSF